MIDAKVFDPRTGKVIEILPPRPANTFVQNWIKMLYAAMNGAGSLSGCVDITNTARTESYSTWPLNCAGSAGSTVCGTVIGTGTNAVTLADYKLQTQVTTNITHGAQAFSLNSPDASHYQMIMSRMFTNGTGSTLNITEVGVYTYDSSAYHLMLDRTLFSVSVPNTLSTTLTYTWTTHI